MLGLIPISDANPTRRFPIVTVSLIAANVLLFLRTPGFGTSLRSAAYFIRNAPLPCQLEATCPRAVLLTSQGPIVEVPTRGLGSFLFAVLLSAFLHAGIFHIAGNMLFLWVFGNNVEDHLGPIKFLGFYLLGAIGASFAHIAWVLIRDSGANVPTVGASGAVAAVLGAYLVLFPRARVNVLVPIFILWTVIQMSAWAVLGLWFLYQFLIGAQEFSRGVTEVAWMAHVGGFVFGFLAILILGGRPQRPTPAAWNPGWRY
ncbi:MAG TPA: rhomboid family intramembrane serine protease [Actinomycetota bacterium]|nr:rhomboid family intramembrane serine protease [Actinomycetota bacterium]